MVRPTSYPAVLLRRTARAGLAGLITALATSACALDEAGREPLVPGGDPDTGEKLIFSYACGTCHVIPGVAGAEGTIGPPLYDWAARKYIAGSLLNTPENLIVWLLDPDAIEPNTAMPDVGMLPGEARDIAAYLFTLGDVRSPERTGTLPRPLRLVQRIQVGGDVQRLGHIEAQVGHDRPRLHGLRVP